jgi:hypothetical protein
MAHHHDDEFSAIDPAALEGVTGGKDASSGTTPGSSNDQLTSALEGITSALKDLKNNGNGNNNFFNQMMPFLLMAFSGRGSITIGGGGAVCGCGCGGHGRCHRR